ncbi:hypothetical protein QLH51_07925 [Sphingomonas sp. 2R-10]|uniref:hypothetical protein n=1 Tax=Sphingomonas sp. 2R-10 TaxID=3045148 RepID=UPI000F78BF56|nr:hypothetical protein [Sphingomonas sp. 2R-10]MDJ0276720.1 hypothetical protein [Sphingomonas sp. 2R-10]
MIDLPPPAIEAASATGFAPALDTAYRYHIEQQRDEAGVARRYTTDRTIRFRRMVDGLVAEMVIDTVDGSLSDGPGAMFERAFATLRGRPIRYTLSDRGEVTGVVDRAGVWSALVDAIAAQAGTDPARAAMLQRLTAPLRAMTERQQVAMLGSMLANVLAPDIVRRGVQPERAIRRPGTPPFGTDTDVTGSERVHAEGRDLIAEERLAGTIPATGGRPTGRRTSTVSRTVDATTGLIVRQTSTVRIDSGDATSIATTRITLRRP